jgi:phosphate transport system substrate-binding protein
MFDALKRTALAAAVAAGTVAGGNVAFGAELIRIDGSSTVYPITEKVAEEFGAANRGRARVTVGQSGTGGGFKKFVRGETDVQDASRPILEKEMADAKAGGVSYIELPIAFDALTIIVNPANTWVDHITVEELKKMWEPAAQGKSLKWSDVRPGWPNAAIKLYGPGADSGTFDYFTEAVVGKAKSSRGDYTASEDDNVLVQGVAGDRNALGYFGYAYYLQNKDKLKAVPVVNPKTTKPALPSEASVKDGSYAPLSRPIFIYVNTASLKRPEVAKFVEFYLTSAPDIVGRVGYVALPDEAYEHCLARVEGGKTGTAYGGKAEVGVSIEELLKRELKQ